MSQSKVSNTSIFKACSATSSEVGMAESPRSAGAFCHVTHLLGFGLLAPLYILSNHLYAKRSR